MGNEQLSGDVTGPDSEKGELDNSVSNLQWQRSPIDEDPAELVDSGLP